MLGVIILCTKNYKLINLFLPSRKMPLGHRKVAFSSKKKKAQMLLKRERKAEGWYGDFYCLYETQ